MRIVIVCLLVVIMMFGAIMAVNAMRITEERTEWAKREFEMEMRIKRLEAKARGLIDKNISYMDIILKKQGGMTDQQIRESLDHYKREAEAGL